MIIVYTKTDCAACMMTKRELTRLELEFREINLDERPEYIEKLRQEGHVAVPVVVTEKDTWSGFRPEKLRTLK